MKLNLSSDFRLDSTRNEIVEWFLGNPVPDNEYHNISGRVNRLQAIKKIRLRLEVFLSVVDLAFWNDAEHWWWDWHIPASINFVYTMGN